MRRLWFLIAALVMPSCARAQIIPAFPVDVSASAVVRLGTSVSRPLATRFADIANAKDFGAAGDGTTDDTNAINNALATGMPLYLPPGTYKTTITELGFSGVTVGPGQIELSDGFKRAPSLIQMLAAPTAFGNFGSPFQAFTGDLSKVSTVVEHRIEGAATLGQPATGFLLEPETSGDIMYLYNINSGWNQDTADNNGRTSSAGHYTFGYHTGSGGMILNYAGGSLSNAGNKAGATSFLANPALELFGGEITAIAGGGTYMQALGDFDLTDNGKDVSAAGLVENFNRTVNTGALGASWMGVRLQSTGTKPVDAFYSVSGPATIGLDLTPMTTGTAGIAMAAGQLLYGNSTNTDTTHFSRYTNPGTASFGYQTATGWTVSGAPLTLPQTTVASLPTCNAAAKGGLYGVTDATAPTYNGTLTGGGAVAIPVYCNGVSWTAH